MMHGSSHVKYLLNLKFRLMVSVSWGSKGIMLVEFLQKGSHRHFTAVCADIQTFDA